MKTGNMDSPNGSSAAERTSWNRFWFQPTDPTALGFMRLVTGVVILYIHLAYCFDLQAFFGVHSWIDLETVNRERKETPFISGSLYYDDWTKRYPNLPDRNDPSYRTSVIYFLNHLPDDRDERKRKLQFFETMQDWTDPNKTALIPFNSLRLWLKEVGQLTPAQRTTVQDLLAEKVVDTNELPIAMPQQILEASPGVRLIEWRKALDFLTLLPASELMDFDHILTWFDTMGHRARSKALELMEQELSENPKDRAKYLEYLDFWNVYPTETYAQGREVFSLWYHVTDPKTMAICHAIIIVVFFLFTIGLFTRVTSVLTWFGALFYIHRVQNILFGMDTMMMILLFYLMIGPSGAAMSVDRLWARYRAGRALASSAGKPVPWASRILAGPIPSRTANFVIRLFQIHFCIIYMASGLAKLKGTMWWNGTANWWTIANPEFSLIYFDLYEDFLRFLGRSRVVLMALLTGMNYFTLVLEISLPFLIWTRMRSVMVIGGILLHSGIAMTMGLNTFGMLMMTMLIAYVPSKVIRDRFFWAKGSCLPVAIHFDSHNPLHRRGMAVLTMFDLAGQLVCHDLTKAKMEPSRGKTYEQEVLTGPEGFLKAAESLVFLKSFSWLFLVPGVIPLFRWWLGVRTRY